MEQGGRCHYCHKKTNINNGNIDHKIPRALGGTDAWQNLVFSCIPCNSAKGATSHQDFTKSLLLEAKRILSSGAVRAYIGNKTHLKISQ